MGRDKADLLYEGRTQLERTLELLAQLIFLPPFHP